MGTMLDYLGRELRACRSRAAVPQGAVAERAEVSVSTISRLERGGESWPDRLTAILDTYAVLCGTTRLALWDGAVARWREDEWGETPRRVPSRGALGIGLPFVECLLLVL